MERARRRRVVGVLIVVLVASVLVFGIAHDAEHALDGAGLACVAVGVAWAVRMLRHLAGPAAHRPVAIPRPGLRALSRPRPIVPRRSPVPLRL